MKHYHLEDIFRNVLIENCHWDKANLVVESEAMKASIAKAGGNPQTYAAIKAEKEKAAGKPKTTKQSRERNLVKLAQMRADADKARAEGKMDPSEDPDRQLVRNPHTKAAARAEVQRRDAAMKKAAEENQKK